MATSDEARAVETIASVQQFMKHLYILFYFVAFIVAFLVRPNLDTLVTTSSSLSLSLSLLFCKALSSLPLGLSLRGIAADTARL
jgi:hypothetical protein